MTPTRIAKHVFAEFIDLSSMLNSICWLLTISGRTSRAIAGFLRPLRNQANSGFAYTLQTANTFPRSADCVQRSAIAFDVAFLPRSHHSRTISSTYFGDFAQHPITRVDLPVELFRQESTY
jgi:hypothetical protein